MGVVRGWEKVLRFETKFTGASSGAMQIYVNILGFKGLLKYQLGPQTHALIKWLAAKPALGFVPSG